MRHNEPTLLVVEDDINVARVLVRLVRRAVATHAARSMREAREWLESKQPLCGAVLDLGLPDGSGLDLVPSLRQRHPDLPIAILTGSLEPELINDVQLLHCTYICKPEFGDTLQAFYRLIVAREWARDPTVARSLAYVAERAGLSLRETQVVAMAGKSLPRRAMAEELGVSENTVKTQVRRALEKTGQASLAELVWEVHSVAEGR